MEEIKETKLSVPVDLVRRSCGIALDMGGSVFKAVYRTQEDVEEANRTSTGMGHLTLLGVSGDRIVEAVQFISTRAVLDRDLSSGLMYTTGLGCSANRKMIIEWLGIKVESQTEFDCFAKAFLYLSSVLSRSELCEPVDTEAAQKHLARARKCVEAFQSMNTDGSSSMGGMDYSVKKSTEDQTIMSGEIINDLPGPMAEVEKDLYPCMLAVCGSGFVYMKINEDRSFNFIDGSASGGKNFMGLGCLLTGAKTFDELMNLASRGTPYSTHIYGEELFEDDRGHAGGSGCEENGKEEEEEEEEEEALYSRFANLKGTVFYCFGKCVGKKLGDYSKEDLARGLVDKFVLDTVQLTTLICRLAGVTRVCFAGSFFSSPLLRSLMTTELTSRNIFNSMTGQTPLKFDFLKPGPQLGAFGALLAHYEKYVTGDNK